MSQTWRAVLLWCPHDHDFYSMSRRFSARCTGTDGQNLRGILLPPRQSIITGDPGVAIFSTVINDGRTDGTDRRAVPSAAGRRLIHIDRSISTATNALARSKTLMRPGHANCRPACHRWYASCRRRVTVLSRSHPTHRLHAVLRLWQSTAHH